MKKILVACEESQAVTIEFRKLGFEAFSCDLLPCSGGHPEWHIEGDVLPLLREDFDLVIAFPPCTYLTTTGNKWMKPEFETRFPTRKEDRRKAIEFFLLFTNLTCKWAIENPVGIMSTNYRKPDQIIQPWQFGHQESKKTCLWISGLPKLIHTEIVEPEFVTHKNGKRDPLWHYNSMRLNKEDRAKIRSKTFYGIAQAMANQWSLIL